MSNAETVIAVSGLAKSFRGRTVIRDVSITAQRGALIGLVGANGGGKTTTLRMLAGLLKPDAGEGMVLGRDIRQPERADRSAIGYLTQRHALYPELTVAENLAFRASIHDLSDRGGAVSQVIETYGLTPHLASRFDELSGGWARRVQLAATMINQPALLLLDEPTAGLDALTRRDIWQSLGNLATAGHTIMISTHDLVEAEQCSSLLFYDQGIAHPQMPPQELMAKANARTLDEAMMHLAEVV